MMSLYHSNIIIEDSNNKVGYHAVKNDTFTELGYTVKRKRLAVGDYMLGEFSRNGDIKPYGNVSIDTKSGLTEMALDLGVERQRFYRELERATKFNIKLIILIEEERISDIKGVVNWINPNKGKHSLCMSGIELYNRICKAKRMYNAEFVFCKKSECGAKIIELLNRR